MTAVVVIVAESVSERAHQGFAATARAAGFSPALVTTADALAAVPHDVEALFDAVGVTSDIQSPHAVAGEVRRIAGDRLAAVVSWSDATLTCAAYAAEALGVARTPADAIARSRNKHAMREALGAAGLASPPYALLAHERDVPEVAAAVGFPAIVKPVNGTGSSLVRRVATAGELSAALRELRASAPAAVDGLLRHPVVVPGGEPIDATTQFLVEKALQGPEYDAEIAVRDGVVDVTLLIRVLVRETTFFGYGYVYPPYGLTAERASAVVAAIEEAVSALGIDNTTANVTVIDDETTGPTLVEINAGRFGGQLIWSLVQDLTGVDVQAQHLALAVGAPPPVSAGAPADFSLAAVTVFADQPGVVVGVHGLDELRAHPQVAYVATFVEPGDAVLGHEAVYAVNAVVFGFEGIEELAELYRVICALVRIETRPLDGAAS